MDRQGDAVSAIHHAIIRTLIDSGACPSNAELRQMLGVDETVLGNLLEKLEALHGVVLHPSERTPWVVHPFSVTPTATYVQGQSRGWWAPCLWCARGAATLVGGSVHVHTRLGGEAHGIVIKVTEGYAVDAEYCVHFAVPPRHAWNNVHAHCAMLLPFRTEQDARDWSIRHRLPFGEVISLDATAALARAWYGRHADRSWQKWTMAEAQSIFDAVGLRSSFWNLGEQSGRF